MRSFHILLYLHSLKRIVNYTLTVINIIRTITFSVESIYFIQLLMNIVQFTGFKDLLPMHYILSIYNVFRIDVLECNF